ncbi:MAG TPA: hypothetical protein VM686_03425, partial [Polyangiaceae bacterium]|nr:hypothetical protein [Polyangiaceae bacterium]
FFRRSRAVASGALDASELESERSSTVQACQDTDCIDAPVQWKTGLTRFSELNPQLGAGVTPDAPNDTIVFATWSDELPAPAPNATFSLALYGGESPNEAALILRREGPANYESEVPDCDGSEFSCEVIEIEWR